jgi:glycosyltransferase involved in cell wall biosynthesis
VAEPALTVLMIGPINHPHLEHLAIKVAKQGPRVVVGGWEWENLPASRLGEAGIPVHPRTAPTRTWMWRLMREVRPDVVHVHWLEYALLAAIYGIHPLVTMAWGSDFYLTSRFWRTANRLVVRRSDVVMADSLVLLRDLERIGAPPSRTALVNWGVDVDEFRPAQESRSEVRARLGIPDRPTILSPRWWREPYNPEVILAGFDRVADELPDVQLVLKHLATEPPDLGASRHADRIHVVGHVPYEQMADFYRCADVCVSVPSSDSSPRSVWEALACGTPCVLSDLPWVHELIRDEEHALVIRPEPDRLATACLRVLGDDSLGARLATAGRELVVEHRNEATEMRRLVGLYGAVARSRNRWPLRRRLSLDQPTSLGNRRPR